MSADMQMARGAAEGEINLAVGEPYFLQAELIQPQPTVRFTWPMAYPSVGGEPELIAELKKLYGYKHIVVTCGAKQAIEAAFFAFKTVERRSNVLHTPPYWPSYPTLAKSQGLDFNGSGPRGTSIHCVTSPNNPDGAQEYLFKTEVDLWDAVYAQPLYGFMGLPPIHRVAVFSAAKQLGLSGLRVGWLGTDEDELARAASYFVEISTSGVSTASQEMLCQGLESMRDPDQMGFYTERTFQARAALMANGASFSELIGDLVTQFYGVPRDGSGMFAWFEAKRPESFSRALRDAKVKVVTGDACGSRSPGWFRMSMGHSPEITRTALERIKDEYYRGWVGQ